MTTKQAIKVVRQIILDNRENGDLEGILNRNQDCGFEPFAPDC
jgi:hypothetical protein